MCYNVIQSITGVFIVLEQISLRISKESKEKLELLAKSTGRSKNFKPVLYVFTWIDMF